MKTNAKTRFNTNRSGQGPDPTYPTSPQDQDHYRKRNQRMNQLAFGDNLSPYNRLASLDGIEYAYSIDLDHNDFWVCNGYALANGHELATWFYHADTFAEARSEDTKLYLLRELRPMAELALRQLSETYTRHFTNKAVN